MPNFDNCLIDFRTQQNFYYRSHTHAHETEDRELLRNNANYTLTEAYTEQLLS